MHEFFLRFRRKPQSCGQTHHRPRPAFSPKPAPTIRTATLNYSFLRVRTCSGDHYSCRRFESELSKADGRPMRIGIATLGPPEKLIAGHMARGRQDRRGPGAARAVVRMPKIAPSTANLIRLVLEDEVGTTKRVVKPDECSVRLCVCPGRRAAIPADPPHLIGKTIVSRVGHALLSRRAVRKERQSSPRVLYPHRARASNPEWRSLSGPSEFSSAACQPSDARGGACIAGRPLPRRVGSRASDGSSRPAEPSHDPAPSSQSSSFLSSVPRL